MPVTQETNSKTPLNGTKQVAPVPQGGARAPAHPMLDLPTDKHTVIVFLRHCGCPFAEKTFRNLTRASVTYKDVNFVAVSHSSPEATERWVVSIGGNWDVNVFVDYERELYAQWGLGVSNTWHVLNPGTLLKTIKLAKDEHIWNRPAESGSRWQTSGAFAVDMNGTVRWSKVAASADDIPDLDLALASLGVQVKPKPPAPVRTEGFL
ncbi:hypothetical protein M426DRAFT_317056 [Hypoxylon sp. CI-4A]|nr:hypothetical protein M426DRAFT_317056 [Hypoxylon sp. CI-4A]